MTTPAGTLREFEQRFLSQRTDAALLESWEAFAKDMLPTGLDDGRSALIHEGFDYGFAKAMHRVRMLLFTMQAEVNAAARREAQDAIRERAAASSVPTIDPRDGGRNER